MASIVAKKDDPYEIVWLVRRLFRAMAQRADRELDDLGISAADRAVMEFLFPDSALTVPEIAARYQVSRQHVQVTVNRLLDARYLVTRENPRHKRSPLIALSKSGDRLFRKIRAREAELVRQAFAGTSSKDRAVTRDTLATLLSHFQEQDK
jgi:DNA-binding MarR family transcriptional regulator